MTREEAITLIKSALKTMYLPKSKEYISDLGYALEIAIKALGQEPKIDENIHRDREQAYMQGYEDASKKYRQEPKWIPVSERLPEDKQAVLVWCPQYRNIYCAYLEKEQWWIFGAFVQIVPNEVIAWMPLPEPYEPQERSEKE